jgi:hypothetical protein
MDFFFPVHESVQVDVSVGETKSNQPILRVNGQTLEIPSHVLQRLIESPGFKTASSQEQVKSYLFAMLSPQNQV